jgi:hypothetical protein
MKYLKTFENMAMAKSIISKKMDGFEKLKTLLKSNLGYIGKFTDYLMNENIPFSDLESIYNDLVDLKNKQKPIDISLLKYEQVLDKIQNTRNDLSVNSLIQQFPSEQKELARQLLNSSGNVPGQRSDSNYNLILQASKKEDLTALLSKIRRYHTKDELKNALKLFGKIAFNDKEQIKEYLKTSKSNLSFENDDTMVVKVNTLEDIQKLGSDTSWCILGSGMWNSYTKGRYQFIIYDFRKDTFDPFFKIGFTLNKDFSVYAAHDILDGSSTSQLNSLMFEQGIKFTQLIPKAEVIDITSDVIERINTRTSLANLQTYADNVSSELILPLIKKFATVTPTLTDGKGKLLTQLLNTYFADAEYVTQSDLKKIDPKIENWSTILSQSSKFLKGKIVYERPEFDSKSLNSDVIVKMLDQWKEESLISAFSSTSVINNLVKIPGSHWLYSGEEVKFSDDWTKEKVTKVSDTLNEVWDKRKSSDKWISLNDFSKRGFNLLYVILNYALDRKEVVDKEVISNLSTNDKVEYAYLLKIPIDLSVGNSNIPFGNYFREIGKWAVPFVVKKDYPDVKLYLEKPSIIALVDKLIDNQLYFKLSKSQKEAFIRRIKGSSNSAGEKKILDTIDKFPRTARVGNKVTSDDGKITIELF